MPDSASLLAALRERVVVADGAMGTMLQAAQLTPDDFEGHEGCNEILNVTRPDVVRSIHDAYLAVGCDAVETNTFGVNLANLAEYGIADRNYELARAGAVLAREAADGHATADRPRWVLGSVGPGTKLPTLGHARYADLRDAYQTCAAGLLSGGVDAVLVETAQDLLQAKAAVVGARRAMTAADRRVALLVNVTVETTGTMLLGSEIGAALTALEPLGIDAIGLNCATGPAEMSEHLRYLAKSAQVVLACMPNAGLAVLDRVGGRPAAPRRTRSEPAAASLYQSVSFRQDTSYLGIGERTNANGSRAFREAMLAGRWDDCVEIARDQTRDGAHLLDVCVDYVGRNGVADMREIAGRFATASTLPLVLDSTEPEVVEAGLECLGGRAVVNSVNYEDGAGPGSRIARMMPLVREHGPAPSS